MDPLSDVCSLVEVKKLVTGHLRMGGPWAWRDDDQSTRSVALGVALKGSLGLSVDGVNAPIHIQEGDCFVLCTDLSYWMSSEPESKSIQFMPFSTKDNDRSLKSLEAVFPFHKEPTNILVGTRFFVDGLNAGPLFDLLPPVIHVQADSTEAPVLRSVLSLLTCDAKQPRGGNHLMIDSLARILFMEVLRPCVVQEDSRKGWLGALVDPKIGAALAVMRLWAYEIRSL